jgi:hypothetical protein
MLLQFPTFGIFMNLVFLYFFMTVNLIKWFNLLLLVDEKVKIRVK